MGSGILVLNQPGVYLVDADGNVITLGEGDTIGNAEAILVAGKDGTVARFVGVDSTGKMAVQNPPNLDAALSSLATEAKLETVRALLATIDADTSNLDVALGTRATEATVATLATEAKLEAVRVLLNSINGKDFATEATLSAADTRLATIDAVLDSIKDTDGVKKITEALPVGTNTIGDVGLIAGTAEIGKVAQGTEAAPAGAWPFYIVDNAGNVVGVVLDGSVYRLQSDSKIAKGMTSADLVHLDAIDTTSGRGRLKTTIFTPDGDAVAFGATSADLKNAFAENAGSSSLLVDGSTTPVVFSYDCDSIYDISLQEIKFTVAANSVTFGNGYFAGRSGPLTTGLLVEVVSDGTAITLFNLVQNESFVNFASPGGFEWVVSSKDMMTCNYLIGGGLKLHCGTSDKVRVTVRDDLGSAGSYLRCFIKGNLLTAI